MDQTVSRGESTGSAADRLSERDRLLIETMLTENREWLVVSHNQHLVSVKPVGRALIADSLPGWWLKYFRANRLKL